MARKKGNKGGDTPFLSNKLVHGEVEVVTPNGIVRTEGFNIIAKAYDTSSDGDANTYHYPYNGQIAGVPAKPKVGGNVKDS